MSNHFSAAYLEFSGGDARLDLTDLYAFPVPGRSGRTVLILDANPFMTGMSATLAGKAALLAYVTPLIENGRMPRDLP